jgi:sodium transport system ATP-binding protein
LAARDRDAHRRAVDELGLADVAGRRAQGFSQGEKMKVAIARALVHDPTRSCSTSPPTASTS